MKLLSVYIDNFGKISNFTYDFSSTLNTIYQENGWGKTTLTIFIKSMLFGLNKQDRIKYTPWKNLTSFGGGLVIEVDGKQYKIERQFNPKKSSLDTFNIYDLKSGVELKDFDSNVGEKFLNLNEDSFERSIYIPEYEIDDGFGSDIEAKLANLIGGTDDSESFDDACQILTNRMHQIRFNSKKGIIIDKKKEMQDIEAEIDDCINKVAGITLIQEGLEIKNKELIKLNEEKKKINQKIIDYTKAQESQTKLAVLKKYEDDVNLTKEKLDKNNEIFNNNELTVEELMNIRTKNKELMSLEREYNWVKEKNSSVYERLNQLEDSLAKYEIPTAIDLAAIGKKIEKLNNIKGIISAHEKEPEKHKPILAITFTIISSIILLAGFGIFGYSFFTDGDTSILFKLIGVCVLIVSVLGYILSLVFFFVNSSKNQPKGLDQVKSYDYELRSTEEEIRAFFSKYHIYSNDYSNNLYTVRSNAQKYSELKAEYDEKNKERLAREAKINELSKEVNDFLTRFNTTALSTEEKIGELNTHLRNKKDIEANLNAKINYINKYIIENNLNSKNSFVEIDVHALNVQIEKLDAEIALINEEKTCDSNKIIEFEADIQKLDELKCKYEMLNNEAKKLDEEYRLLDTTLEMLTKSQNSLLEKYVQPMKKSINKYVKLMLNNDEYNIDTDFKFQFVTENGLKDLDLYSRGLQAIISLCMRLALIDCLYPNEKPFVIFDDPFVNFDDEKLLLCKKLIKTVSKKYQIIYFTCHDSRKI